MEKKRYRYPEAEAKATKKYQDAHYARVTVVVTKEKKQRFQEFCQRHNITESKALNEAIDYLLRKEVRES